MGEGGTIACDGKVSVYPFITGLPKKIIIKTIKYSFLRGGSRLFESGILGGGTEFSHPFDAFQALCVDHLELFFQVISLIHFGSGA